MWSSWEPRAQTGRVADEEAGDRCAKQSENRSLVSSLAPFCRKEKQVQYSENEKASERQHRNFQRVKKGKTFHSFYKESETEYRSAVKQNQRCCSWKHRTAVHSFPVGSTSSESKANLKQQRFCLLSDKPEWVGLA